MHFTVERKRLVKMLETIRRKLPGQKKKDETVRLYACAARVFVESNGVTAGEEACCSMIFPVIPSSGLSHRRSRQN